MDAITFAEAASLAARQGRLSAEERARLDTFYRRRRSSVCRSPLG